MANLNSLERLHLKYNQISDISIIKKLTNLNALYLTDNPNQNIPNKIFNHDDNCLEEVRNYLNQENTQQESSADFDKETQDDLEQEEVNESEIKMMLDEYFEVSMIQLLEDINKQLLKRQVDLDTSEIISQIYIGLHRRLVWQGSNDSITTAILNKDYESVNKYVLVSALNIIRASYRSQTKLKPIDISILDDEDSKFSQSTYIEQNTDLLDMDNLYKAISLLNKSDQEIIEDRYINQMKPAEMVVKYGLSANALRLKLFRTRRRLVKIYKNLN